MVTPRRTVFAVVTAVLAAAPLVAHAGDDTAPRWVRPADGCGTEQINRFDPTFAKVQPTFSDAAQRTIYLNRNGGTYTVGGPTNSATNAISRQVVQGVSGPVVVPPLGAGFNWPNIVTCLRNHYRPYNIKITETEPTSGIYVEAVVGGFGTELGFPRDQLFGIASADNFCGVTEAGIAFSFPETHRQVPRQDDELCATIAHEVGHLLALEHETMATDLMSYVLISQSSTKTFNNANSPCGVEPGQNQQCSCGGASTNSGGRLTSFIGLRPVETVPPSITLVRPGGGELTPSFEVVARASDDMGMEGVTVYLNGAPYGDDFEPEGASSDEYHIVISGVADGDYTMVVEATDQAGNKASVTADVSIARRETGAECLAPSDCVGGVCASVGSENICTQACEPSNDTCPSGFACSEAALVCAPTDEGGCCSTGSSPVSASLLGLAVGLLMVRRRRAARSAR